MRSLAHLIGGLLLAVGLHAAEPAGDAAEPAVNTSTSSQPVADAARDAAAGASQSAGQEPRAAASPAAVAPAPLSDPTSAAPAAAATPGGAAGTQAGARAAADRIELGATQITGNAELPRVMYVVPWKRAELGELGGKPARSLLDEVLSPVDRDVFRRQNRYYDALRPDAATAAP